MHSARSRARPGFCLAAALLLVSLHGCSTQRLHEAPGILYQSYAFAAADEGVLSEQFAATVSSRCGPASAFLPLTDNDDALRWRLLLADLATRSIDVQYYLWGRDESGRLLLQRLLAAADRGVRVRILVDDMFLLDSDKGIALLDSHPNVEISVFNPWQVRGSVVLRALEFLGRAKTLNHRMHNKLFVADNRVAIVGGRNIGNPYFGLNDGYNFRDLEVIGIGPVVEDISSSFDLYWNDSWATRGSAFARPGLDTTELSSRRAQLNDTLAAAEKLRTSAIDSPDRWSAYLERLSGVPCSQQSWVVYDDPPEHTLADDGVRKIEKLRDLNHEIQH